MALSALAKASVPPATGNYPKRRKWRVVNRRRKREMGEECDEGGKR